MVGNQSQDNPVPQKSSFGWDSSFLRANLIFTFPTTDCFMKGAFPYHLSIFLIILFSPCPSIPGFASSSFHEGGFSTLFSGSGAAF